jgi:hypothetical protein
MKKYKCLALQLFFLFSLICIILIPKVANAYSMTPLQISTDITGLVSGPTEDYSFMQVWFTGKDTDDTSIVDEFWSAQRYANVQSGSYSDSVYDGPSNYLVVTVIANGLNSGSYAAGDLTLQIDSQPFSVYMPSFTITTQKDHFSLYIADDGSTFYANTDHAPFNNASIGWELMQGSLDLTPSEAFDAVHLAASAPESEPVPEPTTVALLGIGIVGLTGAEVRRRRKKKAVDKS